MVASVKKTKSRKDELLPPGKSSLDLRKLPTSVIDVKSIIGLVGARNSGKTVCTIDIIHKIRDKVSTAVIFSESEIVSGTFSKVFPETYVYPKMSQEALENIFLRQTRVTKSPPPGVTNTRILLIFDDCASDKKNIRSENFERLFILGRHFGIMVMVLVQYLIALPPACRQNCDYVFCAQELIDEMRKKMFREFFSIFKKPALFNAAMDYYTKDFGLLVLHTKNRTGVLEDTVFWYKATHTVCDFTVGNREYWRLHELFFKEEDDLTFDWQSFRKDVRAVELGDSNKEVDACNVELFRRLDENGEPC